MGTAFDPGLAQKTAPLTRDELIKLAARIKAQDEAHAAQLAAKDELAAAKDAEIERLKAEVAAAQAAKTQTVDTHNYDEAQTRSDLIDLLLGEAGWPLAEPRDREYEVSGMPNESGAGYVDYVLWGSDGLPLAVVEAKRTTKSAGIGQQQARLYADRLEAEFGRRPMVFYTNGMQHWLWDDASAIRREKSRLLHPGRARAAHPAAADPTSARRGGSEPGHRRSALPGAGHRCGGRRLRPQTT